MTNKENETVVELKGYYCKGNLGDDLLLNILREELEKTNKIKIKENNCKINVECKADVLIFGGGTQFFDYDNIVVSLLKGLFWLFKSISLLYRYKKIYMIGVGFGPYRSYSLKKIFHNKIIKKSKKIWVRDIASYQYASKLNNNVLLRTDLVINKNVNEIIKKNASNEASKSEKELKKVMFIIRAWNKEYINFNKKLIKDCVENDIKPSLFLFDKNDLENKELFQEIFLYFRNKNIYIWGENINDLGEALKKISSQDLIVTGRYHGGILSGLLGVPTVLINIDPKLNTLNKIFPKTLIVNYKKEYLIKDFKKFFLSSYEKNESNKNGLIAQEIKKNENMLNELIRELKK